MTRSNDMCVGPTIRLCMPSCSSDLYLLYPVLSFHLCYCVSRSKIQEPANITRQHGETSKARPVVDTPARCGRGMCPECLLRTGSRSRETRTPEGRGAI